MRVLHVVPSFAPAWRYGGPIRSVLRLCQALQRAGVDIEVATTNCDGRADLAVPTGVATAFEGVPVRYFRRWPRLDYAFSPPLARYLAAEARRFDLVHITSVFSFPSLAAGAAARHAGVPYVVSPRGSLRRLALTRKAWKKRGYWLVAERAHLSHAAALHATAEVEQREIAEVLPQATVFVVPNGVDPVDVPPVRRDPRRIVFLGRIHPIKGFDVLVPALVRVARELPEVETVFAGPDDGGEWARVARQLEASHPRPRFRYLGAIDGPARFELLASATALVLTSHSENFGMSVVEAMACSTPVVVSRGCPWEEVERAGAGAWVDNVPEAVAAALLRILRDPAAAARMGEAAASLARRFAWDTVGCAMRQAYESLAATRRAA